MVDTQNRDPDWLDSARRFLSDGLDDIQSCIFGTKSPSESENLILVVLRDGAATAFEISEKTGLGSGLVYSALMRLEQQGRIISEWVPGAYPRQRPYRLSEAEYATQTVIARDLTINPYSPDEQRVMDFLGESATQEAINDPIGFVLKVLSVVKTDAATMPPVPPMTTGCPI